MVKRRDIRRRFYLAVFALLKTPHVSDATSPASSAGAASHESCAIDPKAIVSDACASFSTLDQLNSELQPSIQSLTKSSDFFSYYRLNLYNKECPFWNDESSMCGNIACAVNTIEDEKDVPPIWRAEELGKLEGPKASHPNRRLQKEREAKPLLGELGANVGESCVVEYDDECDERDYCVPEDESATAKGDYVSLVDNPERYTGYSGPGAQQVWQAIYRENCFSRGAPVSGASSSMADPFGFSNPSKPQNQAEEDLRHVIKENGMDENEDECLEKRVFYRVISGMHASISTHLCHDYLNQTTGQWGPNVACYQRRLHDYPDRISNLYFNYALVLRALAKVRPALQSYTFCSGDPQQDALTKREVLALADKVASGPQIYDESLMFADSTSRTFGSDSLAPNSVASAKSLKEDFRERFRNVSRTMDCVGCDKCRLWGKLQTAGYGTALKILFEFDEKDPAGNPPMRRTELVALVNTLDKLSSALSRLGEFEGMLEHQHHSRSVQKAGDDVQAADPIAHINQNIEDEDDGFASYVPPVDPVAEREARKSQLRKEFEHEFGHVFRVTMWVLKTWLELPRDIFHLIIVQLANVWDTWLGITSTTGGTVTQFVGFEKRYPPKRDEV